MDQRAKDFESTVSVSLMEIYNESLRDLLGDGDTKLDVRLDKKLGSTVPGLTTVPCTTADEVFRVIRSVPSEPIQRPSNLFLLNQYNDPPPNTTCLTPT